MINLTLAQRERLAKATEEIGELGQAIGKASLHGYECGWEGSNNRRDMEMEAGDVIAAIQLLCRNGDLSTERVLARAEKKAKTITKYMKFQGD